MATGGVPGGGGVNLPQAGAVVEASGDNPINVVALGYTKVSGMDDPGTYPRG